MTIGEKIIELRKKHNYTQEKLANKIGVSRQTLSNWESNITSPDLNQAKIISEIFKISLDNLTDNQTEIECTNKTILKSIKGRNAYLDVDTDDYRLSFMTKCKILDIDNDFIKIEFEYKKKKITKLLDLNLVASIAVEEGEK